MPPWIMPVFAPDAPFARSFFSTRNTRIPRSAQSRAMPAPLTPPPRMMTSCTVLMKDGSRGRPLHLLGLLLGRELVQRLLRGRDGRDEELLQLRVAHGRRRIRQQVRALLRLRVRDHVAQRRAAAQKHREAIEA